MTGFLLIEVMIALAVAAVTLSALIRFQVDLYHAGALAAQRADALAIAASRIEALQSAVRAGDFPPESGVEIVQAMPDGESLASGIAYVREWTVTAADGVLLIDVTARWVGGEGLAHVVALSSAAVPAAALVSGRDALKPEYIGLP